MGRNYSNTSLETTLSFGINNSTTTVTVGSSTGLPATYPYSIIVDYALSTVEVMSVTAAAGTTLTVVRGQDGTSAQSHPSGSTVVHGVTARDLKEPQDHIDASGNVHGVGASNSVVGTGTTQTLTNKTISGSSNTLTNVPAAQLTGTWATGTITALTVLTLAATSNVTVGGTFAVLGASTLAAVSATTVAASSNATVGGTLGVTGATTTADITASGQIRSTRTTGAQNSFYADLTGDTQPRLIIQGDGDIYWASGSTSVDTRLYRSAASTLKTDAAFEAAGAVTIGGAASVAGNLTVTGRIDNARIRARGRRTTATSYSASTSDVDVFRFDDIPVISGHTYRIDATQVHVDATTANNSIVVRWRYTADSSTPTSSSSVLGAFKTDVVQTTNIPLHSFTCYYHAGSNHDLSLLLTIARGSGSGSVRMFPPPEVGYMEYVVVDESLTPALSGTVL